MQVERVRIFARIPARAVRAVLLNQIRTLAEPCVILAVVTARLGGVVIKVTEHLVAHLLPVPDFRVFQRLSQQRIGVLALAAQVDVEGLMVHARAGIGHVLGLRADPLGQHLRGSLHAVAQTRDLHPGVRLHRFAQHAHGVGVVQEHSPGTVCFDVAADLQHQRNVAQGAEDAGDAAGVAHVDVHAVCLGNLDVVAPDRRIAVEDGANHAVGAVQRLRPIRRGGDYRLAAKGLVDPLCIGRDPFQPLGIDVHQGDLTVLECREGQQVAHQIPREYEAAGADESEFLHDDSLLDGLSLLYSGSIIRAMGYVAGAWKMLRFYPSFSEDRFSPVDTGGRHVYFL